MARILKFGKYKGKSYTKIILTHIGYIMWCLNNLSQFRLTDEEQELYDAVAIAIIDSSFVKTPFPKEGLIVHIKDKNALENRDTPIYFTPDLKVMCNKQSPIYKRVIDEIGCCCSASSRPIDIGVLFHEKRKIDDFFMNCGYDGVDYNDF